LFDVVLDITTKNNILKLYIFVYIYQFKWTIA